MLKLLWNDEDGLTAVEFILLLALVAILAVAAWTLLGQHTSTTATGTTSRLPSK